MGKHTDETPFPTGLFKSEGFLRKVEAAMRGHRRKAGVKLVKVRDGGGGVVVVDGRTGKVIARTASGEKGGIGGLRGAEVVSVEHVVLPTKKHVVPWRAKSLSGARCAAKGFRAGRKPGRGMGA